jgi:hypothetical protein
VSSFKVGDKVLVECVVIDLSGCVLLVFAKNGSSSMWVDKDACRTVEQVVNESLTTECNYPEIPDSSSDPVNPAHYKQGNIECIEAIKGLLVDGFPDYLRRNVIKYLWRYKEKGGVEDLRKSAWYLDRLIKEVGE